MADVPGYGAYSNAEAYLDYKQAILHTATKTLSSGSDNQACIGKTRAGSTTKGSRHPRVRLLLFAPLDRETGMRTEFERNSFLRSLNKGEGRDQLHSFLEINREPLRGSSIDFYIHQVMTGEGYEALIRYLLSDQHR